ncbi:unannotated protein [freshwater metagenome]|uniref:Unannotated protein n=1 Tax=freshwater metagenome TaxID=449393 RepID=A0A6J6TED6_9ZZZZ
MAELRSTKVFTPGVTARKAGKTLSWFAFTGESAPVFTSHIVAASEYATVDRTTSPAKICR